MNFGEVRFWVILGVSLLAVGILRLPVKCWWSARTDTFDRVALISIGLLLLLAVSWQTFMIYAASALATFCSLKWIMQRPEERRLLGLAVLAPALLLPLFWYKYANFLLNDVAGLGVVSAAGLIIPAGISFYSFQKVAFVVDTIRQRQPLPSFLNFLNFAGFFPQVVAGPIERREDLLPQMERFRFRWNVTDINEGCRRITLGLFYKCVLADNLATLNPPELPGNAYAVWLANLLFGLRIYFDFAGYSLTALGIARCLGVTLTLNFASPYCSTSIGEFWRRWHISLSQWFRDYVYLPLGGGRSRWWWAVLVVVFLVSGIWHGAGWSFVLWGAMHAAFMICHRLSSKRIQLSALAGWLLTQASVLLAWLPFYEVRPTVMLTKLQSLCLPASYVPERLRALLAAMDTRQQLSIALFLGLTAVVVFAEWRSLRTEQPYRHLMHSWVLIVMVLLMAWFTPTTSNSFIYFAF